MNKKILARTILAVALVCIMTVGLISAYFTDIETKTNTFTVGSIDIELQEPNWVEPTDILPEQEIAKDPQIENVGANSAYVFLEVEVPYANVVTAAEDGTKNEPVDTELFSYTVNEGWVQIGEGTKDEDAKTVTYLYAYGTADEMTALEKGATTSTLFDYVKFANVVNGQNLEGSTQYVIVKAYAVQTTNINSNKTEMDGNNDGGEVTPADVWAVISK
jgi:predicted ribosomally synthesized peptide with SipW-like signal peptide